MTRLVVATRASRLALAQTQWVIDSLKAVHPGLEVAIHTVTTHGDQDNRTELWKFTSSGLFTSQVEHAILEGKADFAVHSFKDLPTELTGGLCIAAIPRRHPPEDCLVCDRAVSGIEGLWPGAKVGTSSPRRIALLRNQRSDLEIVTVRGNVETRVKKVTSGQVDAVVMARAGLDRIGLSDRIACILDPMRVYSRAGTRGAGDSVPQRRSSRDQNLAGSGRSGHAVGRRGRTSGPGAASSRLPRPRGRLCKSNRR